MVRNGGVCCGGSIRARTFLTLLQLAPSRWKSNLTRYVSLRSTFNEYQLTSGRVAANVQCYACLHSRCAAPVDHGRDAAICMSIVVRETPKGKSICTSGPMTTLSHLSLLTLLRASAACVKVGDDPM